MLLPDRLSSFVNELQQPATATRLQHLAATTCSDPLQAASQLHAVLHDTAAAVFPPAPAGAPARAVSASRQLQRRHPWFDAKCAAARERLRLQLQAYVACKQPSSHLAKEALRVLRRNICPIPPPVHWPVCGPNGGVGPHSTWSGVD